MHVRSEWGSRNVHADSITRSVIGGEPGGIVAAYYESPERGDAARQGEQRPYRDSGQQDRKDLVNPRDVHAHHHFGLLQAREG